MPPLLRRAPIPDGSIVDPRTAERNPASAGQSESERWWTRTTDLFLISVLRGGRRVGFAARFHGAEPNRGLGLLGVRAVRWGRCASGVPSRVGRLCSPRGGLAPLTSTSAEAGGGAVKASPTGPSAASCGAVALTVSGRGVTCVAARGGRPSGVARDTLARSEPLGDASGDRLGD
jgi:hypothetical protein